MSLRPLVALPGRRAASVSGLRFSGTIAAEALCEAIWAAGGEPLVIHGPDGDAGTSIDHRLARFDGVLMPGGGDLSPAFYGQQPSNETEDPVAHNDVFDLAVVGAVLRLGLPTLAVCRGMQVLNVALGGSLHQHLDRDAAGAVAHHDSIHPVDVVPGSRLHAVTGQERLEVSSYHHQAVDRIGADLEASATASDGCIEALEIGEVLAVQWHPEDLARRSLTDAALFTDLVERSAKSATNRTSHHVRRAT